MANKRIKDLSTNATEADLVAGNYLAIDGSAGTKKLPAELVAKRSVQDKLAGNASAEKQQIYTHYSNDLYYEESGVSGGKIWIKSLADNWTGRVFSGFNYTNAQFAAALGVSLETSASGVTNCIPIESEKSLVIDPSRNIKIVDRNSVAVEDVVILGCANGNIVACNTSIISEIVFDKLAYVNKLMDADKKGHSQLYVHIADELYYEESRTSSGKVWIKATSDRWVGRNGFSFNYTNAQFAAALGVSLETSASGVTNCIPIADSKCIVVDYSGTIGLKSRGDVLYSDVIILGCLDGCLVQCNSSIIGRLIFDKLVYLSKIVDKNKRERGQLYTHRVDRVYYEESREASGKIWFKSTGDRWVSRNAVSFNYTNAQFATALGLSVETSSSGVTNCIPLADGKCLVLNANGYEIKSRSDVLYNDIVVLGCIDGHIIDCNAEVFGSLIMDKLSEINPIKETYQSFYQNDNSFETKARSFASLFKTTSKCDSFLFLTDPHVQTGTWYKVFAGMMSQVLRWFNSTPVTALLSGGDWLTHNIIQDEALEILGYIDGFLGNNFKNYYPVLGNHDTNYQGYIDDDDHSRGDLPQGSLDTIMFNRVGGRAYYEFDLLNTHFYAFDSGLDWDSGTMTAYRWEQVAWFAEKLLATDKPHSAIFIHIGFRTTGDVTSITPLSTALLDIATAYNGRTSITKNGVTYDFSASSGYVEFFICGHTHSDMDTIVNNIPVVSTINALAGGCSFDLCMVDYTNNKLKMTRVGNGSDRSFDLFSASL